MIKREDLEKIRSERNMVFIALLFASAMILIAVLLVWKGQITGYQALDTLEYAPHVTGSSSDGSLHFEEIPDFRVAAGQTVRFKLDPNTEGARFTDDTHLFDITDDGTVEFEARPEDAGHHRVLIFMKKGLSQFYFQDLHIIIED